jgi:subtilase family serine protease
VNVSLKLVAPLIVVLAFAACNAGGVSPSMPGTTGQSLTSGTSDRPWGANVRPACPAPKRPGEMRCFALVNTGVQANEIGPAGYAPSDFQSAYHLPSSTKGKGQTVAIVDAFDNPNVASDLNTYRSRFGLPKVNFKKYNQVGKTKNYPTENAGWGVEEDLDVDMVSASCPNCTIWLIEATSNSSTNLDAAEREAVKLGATIVTNSWGGGCVGSCYGTYFDTPGVTYLASAGDGGYGDVYPMELATVVAVGGTSLYESGGTRHWTEVAWEYTGGGCATAITKPSWQHDPDCTGNMRNDVAADADPATGAAEYDTFEEGGWIQVGGTSLSSPLTAGIFALAGNSTTQNGGEAFWKAKGKHLFPVTSGIDFCPPSATAPYFCTMGTGEYLTYGGPDGWGTPDGIAAY